MTLIALLLALVLDRLVTPLAHWREPRWIAGYFGWIGRWAGAGLQAGGVSPAVVAIVFVAVALPVLPVAVVAGGLDVWRDSVWMPFAVLVLAFSLGPRNLFDEAREYLDAEDRGDWDRAKVLAADIIEHDAAQRRALRATAVEDALFVQANNRLAGVVFWFLVAGPAGAWLFRVSDLLRRAAIEALPSQAGSARLLQGLHALLAWVPARLLALSYAVAGSFEDARVSWKEVHGALPAGFSESSDRFLVALGRGALGAASAAPGAEPAVAALRLIRRAAVAWLTVIAILTLVAWIA